jgi:hypothetical protein
VRAAIDEAGFDVASAGAAEATVMSPTQYSDHIELPIRGMTCALCAAGSSED